VPVPSIYIGLGYTEPDPPASVDIPPERLTIIMRCPPYSETMTLPLLMIREYGWSKITAAVPIPLLPTAMVDTYPYGVTLRRTLPNQSATTRSPFENTAIPDGKLNVAVVPIPSLPPADPDPANVKTMNDNGEIKRMRLLYVSATAIFPSARTATPYGNWNLALVAIPSAYPWARDPAIVETTPVGVTRRTRLLEVSAIMKSPPAVIAIP